MTVEADAGLWVVPLDRAAWVPAFEAHRIQITGAVEFRSFYLVPQLSPITDVV